MDGVLSHSIKILIKYPYQVRDEINKSTQNGCFLFLLLVFVAFKHLRNLLSFFFYSSQSNDQSQKASCSACERFSNGIDL